MEKICVIPFDSQKGIIVNLFSLMKELKKRLRRKRRWLLLGTWLFLFGAVITAGWLLSQSHSSLEEATTVGRAVNAREMLGWHLDEELSEPSVGLLEKIKNNRTKHPVVLQIQYVCGEEVQQLGEMDGEAILKIHERYPQALITMSESRVVIFTELVNDLSPECKKNTYFGLDASGNLSLFDGLPQDDKVLKTFFQLNIRYLESSLPRDAVDHLHHGIRITDIDDFHSVLSTFSDFAIEETEQVMKSR